VPTEVVRLGPPLAVESWAKATGSARSGIGTIRLRNVWHTAALRTGGPTGGVKRLSSSVSDWTDMQAFGACSFPLSHRAGERVAGQMGVHFSGRYT
jgi:hypothetical protein